jgi:hypothetical protein
MSQSNPVPPRHLARIKGRGSVGQRGYEHWHLTRDRKGQFRTTTQENARENPIDFVKHRALWLGGLAAVSAAVVGGIAYMAARSAGTTTPNATTAAPGATDVAPTAAPTTAVTPATTAAAGTQMHTVAVTNGANTPVTVTQGDVINVTTPSGATGPTVAQNGGTGSSAGSVLLNGQLKGSFYTDTTQLTVGWTLGGIAQTATITTTVNQ